MLWQLPTYLQISRDRRGAIAPLVALTLPALIGAMALAVDVGFLYVYFHYGLNMEKASPERAVAATKIPVLLIHGLDDTNIPPYHSDRIQAKNPSDVVVWKVPGAVHTGAHKAAPQEFDRRVLEWFGTRSEAP